jgi:hypothetical protein
MIFDLTFPCYLTSFSGKKCLSGKVICAFFFPLIEVLLYPIMTTTNSNNNYLGNFLLPGVRWLAKIKADPRLQYLRNDLATMKDVMIAQPFLIPHICDPKIIVPCTRGLSLSSLLQMLQSGSIAGLACSENPTHGKAKLLEGQIDFILSSEWTP